MFQVAPKVKLETSNIYFTSSGASTVQLMCEVECGLPNLYTYTWTWSNGSVLYTKSNTDLKYNEYPLQIPADSTGSTFEVVCTVTNGQATSFQRESQTRFVVTYKQPGKQQKLKRKTKQLLNVSIRQLLAIYFKLLYIIYEFMFCIF